MTTLPGTPTAAKWVSQDEHRLEVQYDDDDEGFWFHYRKDRDLEIIKAILELITPEPYVAPVVVPVKVTKYQAKVALMVTGQLDAVEALMSDAYAPKAAQLAWSEATHFYRDSEFIALLAPSLNMDNAEIDALFVYAEQV